MTAKLTCADCRWWHYQTAPEGDDSASEKAVGYCRRFPPERRDSGVGAWPVTFAYDWCGEYVHKDDVSYQIGSGFTPAS